MSVRNLEHLFRPRSIAVIGASDRPSSIGALLMRNLRGAGFEGPIWPVNRRHDTVAGMKAWRTPAALPAVPELAVICTPADTVPGLVAELGLRGNRAAVVLSAGLRSPARAGGPTCEQQMLEAAAPHLLRILGPNSVGLLVPGARLNASFAHAAALPGSLAFVSQSGALAATMLDWANSRGIGFSHFVSMGECADVDFGDMLDYLGSDGGTRAILLYIESIRDARKFMSAARSAARNKPVIVVKAGRAPEGAQAAASHTGALAGSDVVFEAAIRRAGMLRVDTLSELFDAAATLTRVRVPHGQRLAVLGNGGGAGVLAADALSQGHGELAQLDAPTLALLDAVLPATWSRANPVDIVGDASAERYLQAFDILQRAPGVDALLLLHAPNAMTSSDEIAQALLPKLRGASRPVLCGWLGGEAVAQARRRCEQAGIAAYDTPERAVTAFLQLLEYRRNQQALLEMPGMPADDFMPDTQAARALIAKALGEERAVLDEFEAKALLGAYGIPIVETRVVADAGEAVAQAAAIGYPVVLKIVSPDISHKSDVGGVALGLDDADALRAAAEQMLRRVRELRPDARIAGFTVQAMIRRPHAHELIVGMATDAMMGPVLLFGQGGTAVEVIRDRQVELPPLNRALARQLVARTRVAGLLAGYRDRAPIDHEALYTALIRISQLVCELPEVIELDINPLLADAAGVIALDARVVVARAEGDGARRLAIRPYPSALETYIDYGEESPLLRPIRPEDAQALQSFYAECAPRDLRLRFFMVRREVPHSELARYTQIDYDREMVFVAMGRDAQGAPLMFGEVRAVCDPDNEHAEFAVQVRSGGQQRGLGRVLMLRMIDYLRARGTRALVGEFLVENEGMRRLARALGMKISPIRDAPGSLSMHLDLAPPDADGSAKKP